MFTAFNFFLICSFSKGGASENMEKTTLTSILYTRWILLNTPPLQFFSRSPCSSKHSLQALWQKNHNDLQSFVHPPPPTLPPAPPLFFFCPVHLHNDGIFKKKKKKKKKERKFKSKGKKRRRTHLSALLLALHLVGKCEHSTACFMQLSTPLNTALFSVQKSSQPQPLFHAERMRAARAAAPWTQSTDWLSRCCEPWKRDRSSSTQLPRVALCCEPL